MAPIFSAAVDSKRSAPRPAQSPTLSPTRSAMTAGLRGSSSGMPASTLPTRSAPTSAALVKMPPPTRLKRARNVHPDGHAHPQLAHQKAEHGAHDEGQCAGEADHSQHLLPIEIGETLDRLR